MKNLRAFSLCLAASALTLSACQKDDPLGDTGPSTVSTTSNQEEEESDTSDSGMTTFGEEGDGDGDPASTTMGTTMGFVPMTDTMAVSECDPWAQDCPEGEKCVAYGSTGGNWDANKCVLVTGDGQQGDP